jgi:hypothetical protein
MTREVLPGSGQSELFLPSRLDWIPDSIFDANQARGSVRPSQTSGENFKNCAWSLNRILLLFTEDRLRGGLDCPYRPPPLIPGKLLICLGLSYPPFRSVDNSYGRSLVFPGEWVHTKPG